MANLFSDLLTLRDTAGSISDFGTYSGDVKTTRTFISVLVNPTNGDVIMMVDIPSNAKPHSIQMFNEALGTGSVSEVGIYAGEKFTDTDAPQTVFEKNDVILIDAFDSTSSDLNSTNLDVGIELRFQVGGSSSGLVQIGDAMWELAGLDSDPFVDMRIGITITTNFTGFGVGEIAYIVKYTSK